MRIQKILESRSAPDVQGCMNWLRCKDSRGYGRVQFSGKQQRAHRVIWEHYNGEIPQGMLICHHCDNPACCNPGHLFMGSHLDNHRDKVRKGRQPRGMEIVWTRLKDEDVFDIRAKYAQGFRIRTIATAYSIGWGTARKIITGRTWNHLPGSIKKTRDEDTADSTVQEIRRLFEAGKKTKEIALELKMSQSTVYHIATGRRRSIAHK